MAKIPVTDNDFRLLTVWDVQEINTTIYSAELRFDFDEQSVYYGVLDSILKKSSLLTDPGIIPLISQFIGYGNRIGNVPQQYTTLINFRNAAFEEQQENGEGDDEFDVEEEIDTLPDVNVSGTVEMYYPIIDSREAGLVKIRKRLSEYPYMALPYKDTFVYWNIDWFYFFSSTQELNKWFQKNPILEYGDVNGPQKKMQIYVAVCIIPNYVPITSYPVDLSDNTYQNQGTVNNDILTLFSVETRFNRNILITDVIEYRLKHSRYFFTPKIKIKKIGTG